MNKMTAQILSDIIQAEMNIEQSHIWVRNQNRKIPNNDDMYVIVGLSYSKPQSTQKYIETRTTAQAAPAAPLIQDYEVQRVQMCEFIQIDVLSRNNDAMLRNWEVLAALKSILSQQTQEANSFKIFGLPTSFVNSSDAEGGSTINRFSIIVPCFVWYQKSTLIPAGSKKVYDYFDTRVDDETTIKTAKGIIQFTQGVQPFSTGSPAVFYYDPMLSDLLVGDRIDKITFNGQFPAVASGSTRPKMGYANDRKVITFEGNQELLSSNLTINPQSFTMVFVTNHYNFLGSGGLGQNILAGVGGGPVRNIYYNYTAAAFFDNNVVKGSYGDTLNDGMFNIITIVGNGTNLIVRANGVEVTPSAVLVNTLITSLRFGRNETLNQSLIGDIAYFEYFDTAADLAGRQAIDARLRALSPYVVLDPTAPSFIFDGNSLVEGVGADLRVNRWSDAAMAASRLSNKTNFMMHAWSGITTASMVSIRAATLDPIMVPGGTNSFLFVWELTNSINSGQTGAQAFATMTTYCNAIKALFPNVKIVMMTMLPRQASATVETERINVNNLVMATTTQVTGPDGNPVPNLYSKTGAGGFDYVMNVAADANIGAPNAQNNTTYFLADKTHLTPLGYTIVKGMAANAINYLGGV